MHDLGIDLGTDPAALADLGEALGAAGISIEGGGAWMVAGRLQAHFLVQDGVVAERTLRAAGIEVGTVREVLAQRLDQARAGQVGEFTRRLARAGVSIEVLYSDHANRLIVGVDDLQRGQAVSRAWQSEWENIA